MGSNSPRLPPLIAVLMRGCGFDHPVVSPVLFETHISWVILTGPFAYKIKKPVDLGFLDFSTLERRRFFCEEEIRLNRRLAPDVYLSVVTICGTPDSPNLSGEGEAIEYAVKMRQFDPQDQLDLVLARGELHAEQIDRIATRIAEFHTRIPAAGMDCVFGDPDHVHQPILENFRQIRERIDNASIAPRLNELSDWSERQFQRLRPMLSQRKQQGFIRECHGDMHLRNIAWVENAPLIFDGIEFNPNLRWIDVISEIAFLVMDLIDRKHQHLARRLLNRYLESTGDYGALPLLPFYLVYRAMVRAKVEAIRAHQAGISRQDQRQAEKMCLEYVELATGFTKPGQPHLIIMHGLSGSGKSYLSERLVEHVGALRLRSDVERKRLFGLECPAVQMYSDDATQATYGRLLDLAEVVLDAGNIVIVDATFSKPRFRKLFHDLAVAKKRPFTILEAQARPDTLRERLLKRSGDVSDADVNVLAKQLARWQPLDASERPCTVTIETDKPLDMDYCWDQIVSKGSAGDGVNST